MIAAVAIDNSVVALDKEYYYEVPDELVSEVKPGIRVVVPFGVSDRTLEGMVLTMGEFESDRKLKRIKAVLDKKPVITDDLIKLAKWMKHRYICTYSNSLKCMTPFGSEIKLSLNVVLKEGWQSESLRGICKRIVDTLLFSEYSMEYEDLKEAVNSKQFVKSIKKLEEMGIVECTEEVSKCVREKYLKAAYLVKPEEEVIIDIESNIIDKIEHIKVLEILMESECLPISEIVRYSGISRSVLNTLEKYGYIGFKQLEISRAPLKDKVVKRTYPFELTPIQDIAIKKIKKHMDSGEFSEHLLYGVTGSGKTEVYMQLIQYCLDSGKQAIVLVPEISLTQQMVDQFQARFGDGIAVIHSRLSLGERYDQWKLIWKQAINVVIGARSAVFAPLNRLGIIIIDEEHEMSYKSEITPKYHAQEVARQRCMINNILLLSGSATPSEESFYRAREGEINLIELPYRANQAKLPVVSIVNMKDELASGNRSIFSRQLHYEIQKNIEKREQTIIFINKRGFSSFVLCRSCGYVIKCKHCDISLTYHSENERLICHYCGYTVKNVTNCPSCNSKYIKSFGAGTQKVEQELKKLFPQASILRMDMDTTNFKNSHQKIISEFRDKQVDILVGTQMIAKGHHFPKVTLVGVVAADITLNMSDYRASERTFQLITQVSGRAGRGQIDGRVIVQTYNQDSYSIVHACKHDYCAFYKDDIEIRDRLCLPPFYNIGLITISGIDDKSTYYTCKKVHNFIEKQSYKSSILGPSRAQCARIKNKFRWQIVLKNTNLQKLVMLLTDVSQHFYGDSKRNKNINLAVDINPSNII